MTIHLPKVNEFGGGSGGGGSAFPTTVTDSGSSLPSASGYQVGDTFLNTSDKKIYKTEVSGYIANTNTRLSVNVDYITGVASGWTGNTTVCQRTSLTNQWYGTSEIKHSIKFKVDSIQNTPIINFYAPTGSGSNNALFKIMSDGYIYHTRYNSSSGSWSILFDNKILDTQIVANKVYILNITKTGANCVAQLTDENGTILEEKNFTTENLTSGTNSVFYGAGRIGSSNVYSSNLSVYLGQSAGELVIPNTSTLSWDNGTDITDKTEYADKTNGALYLYENSELVKIGGSFPTIVTDGDNTGLAVEGNTIYKFGTALTSLTISSVETSDYESIIYFTTGAGTISLSAPNTLRWGGGNEQPTLEPNTVYCIAIRNGLAEIDNFGTTA